MAQNEYIPSGIAEQELPAVEYLAHLVRLREEAPFYFNQLLNRYWDSVPQQERLQISEEMPEQFRHSVGSTRLYWQDYLVGRMAQDYVAALESHTKLTDAQIVQLTRDAGDGGEVEPLAA